MNKNRIIITILIVVLLLLLPLNVFAITYGKVGESTNFDGDINIPSGSKYHINGVAMELVQCLSNGTTAPTADDDSDDGYSVNSIWADTTNDKSYICVDSTVANAVWQEITIGKNYYSALGSDHTYSDNADTDSQPVGESVVFGNLLYFNWTDKEWKKAIASAYATTPAERIALESKVDGQTCLMLIKGYIRDDSAFDFGASKIFLNDDTAGTCDDTAPAESGDQIQMVGTAKSADILFFNPSIDVGEI